MSHTKIVESADAAVLAIPVDKVDQFEPKGKVTAATAPAVAYAVLDNGSVNMATLRFHLKDVSIKIAEQAFDKVPAGSFIVPASAASKLTSEVESLGLNAVPLAAQPTVPTHEAPIPRLRRLHHLG
jgi:hypothetical protein